MDPFNASSTASFSTLEARTVLTLVTVGGGGAVGAARPRVRMRKERIKGTVEREGRCISDLGVGKFWIWTGIGEGMGPVAVGLRIACALKKGDDVMVLIRLTCSAFHPLRITGRGSIVLLVVLLSAMHSYWPNGPCSCDNIVIGYAFI